MSHNLDRWRFERGLDEDFMKKLEAVAKQPGWFADVLADPDLILGIRKNYMNVYWHGQSLFKIERKGKTGQLKFSTHPKYLIDPGLSKAVTFDGSAFQVGGHEALARRYETGMLARMKRAAKVYSGGEKDGVHAVACANLNVIDTEIAFSSEGTEDQASYVPRADLACLEDVENSIRLRFWEAKLYGNPELRATGDTPAPVIEQVRRYRCLVEKHRKEIVESYTLIAKNLIEMAGWADGRRKIGDLIKRVPGSKIEVDTPPIVGLIVYGFDAAQKSNEAWKTHQEKLMRNGDIPVVCAGNAKNIRLKCPKHIA